MAEVQLSPLENDTYHLNSGEQQIDAEQATLSSSKLTASKEKLELYRIIKKTKKICWIFDTKCQLYLFVAIAALILLALFLVFDNHVQQKEISLILNKLIREDGKPVTPSLESSGNVKASSTNNAQNHDSLDAKEMPRKIWYYNKQNIKETRKWTQKCYERAKQIAEASGYTISLLNVANWKNYLSPQKQQKVDSIVKQMNELGQKRSKEFVELVTKQITVLEVLHEKGGIFIDEDIVLTESLHWVENISSNQFVNARELLSGKAQVVGFHSVQYSSEMKGQLNAAEPTNRYMVRHPSLNFYFIACTASSQFIEDVLIEYYEIVANYDSIPIQLQTFKNQIEFYSNNRLNDQHLFHIACQLALRKKELELDTSGSAIEYYQIASINQNYGPTKLGSYLGDTQIDKLFNHLSLLPLQQLEYEFGAIRYLAYFPNKAEIYNQFEKIVDSKTTIKNSFIYEHLLASQGQSLMQIKMQDVSSQPWSNFPNKLWMYLKEPPFKNSFFMQIWIEHLKKRANQSNFQFIIVTEMTLTQYLQKETIDYINLAITSNKLNLYESTRSQLISLAILHEHGGIWVEPYAFFLDNLNWFHEIGKEQFIWNKFGETPKVVVAFHPHFGSPFHWVYTQSGAKQAWHLAYEHSFIAAEPKTQLIKDWLVELASNIQLTFPEVQAKFEMCKINNHKWINDKDQDLLSQDSIKCVLGAKTVKLQSQGDKHSANEYYGLWGINGFAGLLKTREYTNFLQQKSMENPFIWRYSFDHMEKSIGKISHFARLYQPTASKIQQLYLSNFQNPLKQFHNDSFIMRMITQIGSKVVKLDDGLYLSSYQQDYQLADKAVTESASLQQLSNIAKIVWIYQGGDIDTSDFNTNYILKNIHHYSHLSGFEVRIVNDKNYKLWLISESQYTKKLNNFLTDLQKKVSYENSNIRDHYVRIKGEIILMTLLYEFGGVFISKKIILHEDFSWLKSVEKMHFVNKEGNTPPKVFGFFSPGYSPKAKDNQMVKFPSLEDFFLASGKKTAFVKDFIDQYISIILYKENVKPKLQSLRLDISYLHGVDPYYEAFFIACQFTLKKMSDQLISKQISHSPIQQYGLYSFNTHFYPYKLHRYYSSFQTPGQIVAKELASVYVDELEQEIGKLRLFSIVPAQDDLKRYIQNAMDEIKGFQIQEHSFLHEYLMFNDTKGVTKRENLKSKAVSTAKKWENLPQKAWVYVPNSIKTSSFSTQLLFSALKAKLAQAGFELIEINDRNVDDYADKFVLRKVNRFIGAGSNNIHKELLYRLAVLLKHGGVSFSSRLLAVQDLKWINQISSADKKLFFNPYGSNPSILLSVEHLRGPYNAWSYDQQLQARVGHNVGWNSAFIAAERQNELINEWLEELTSYKQMNERELAQQFNECQVPRLWSRSDQSKLGSDALVCILNRKQKELEKTKKKACEYYGLWGIDESTGLNKLSEGLNLDVESAELNPFLWKWPKSSVQELIGPIRLLVELSQKQMQQLDSLIKQHKLGSWGDSDSILVQHVYNIVKPLLREESGQISLKN